MQTADADARVCAWAVYPWDMANIEEIQLQLHFLSPVFFGSPFLPILSYFCCYYRRLSKQSKIPCGFSPIFFACSVVFLLSRIYHWASTRVSLLKILKQLQVAVGRRISIEISEEKYS